MVFSSLKLLRSILLISLLSSLCLYFYHLKTTRELEEKTRVFQSQKNLKPVKTAVETRKPYGYAEILDIMSFFPDLKILKLDNSSGNIIFEVELNEGEDQMKELVNRLSEKGNFIGVSRLQRYQKNGNADVLNLTLEFSMS